MDCISMGVVNGNAYITKYGYLSIDKFYLNNTKDNYIQLGNVSYNIDKLKMNISYSDNKNFYRWKSSDYNKCII